VTGNSELSRRLAALEAKMNSSEYWHGKPGDPLHVVVVHGCLPPGEPLFATAGALEWIRKSDEELEAFAHRCAQEALEHGERLLVIGGLPASQAQHDVAMAAYDRWAASDDGIPPVEVRGPAYSRLGRRVD
jgi:hypothetical protein